MQPTVERVVEAADALKQLRLGRDASTLIRWMAVKFTADAGTPVVRVTSAMVTTFCGEYFAVPGQAPHVWFDPFGSGWQLVSTNKGWPVGTVWSRLKQSNNKQRAMFEVTPVAGGHALDVQPRAAGYMAALQSVVPADNRVPAVDLAVWRFRFGLPTGVESEDTIVEALAEELHLTDDERATVFR